jgi:hypothetical protein
MGLPSVAPEWPINSSLNRLARIHVAKHICTRRRLRGHVMCRLLLCATYYITGNRLGWAVPDAKPVPAPVMPVRPEKGGRQQFLLNHYWRYARYRWKVPWSFSAGRTRGCSSILVQYKRCTVLINNTRSSQYQSGNFGAA